MDQKHIIIGLSALLFAATPAHAENEPAQAEARIFRPINFAMLLEMDFGQIIAGAAGGTIILDEGNGSRNCGTLVCTGAFTAARLTLSGSDATVVVTYDTSIQLTGPGDPMTVTPTFAGGSGTIIQLTGGSASVDFGGVLTVNPNQTDGEYQGTFTVNVEYL
jgi:hypothetical protein